MPQGPNMNQLLKQAQQMQAEMAKAQEQLKNEVVEASAGGGMIKVTMTGDMQLREIKIDPEAVDPEDVDMLQDMVAAAVNEALGSGAGGQSHGRDRRARWGRRSGSARYVGPPRSLRFGHVRGSDQSADR
jgi:nucleoid-associated protein EbfC